MRRMVKSVRSGAMKVLRAARGVEGSSAQGAGETKEAYTRGLLAEPRRASGNHRSPEAGESRRQRMWSPTVVQRAAVMGLSAGALVMGCTAVCVLHGCSSQKTMYSVARDEKSPAPMAAPPAKGLGADQYLFGASSAANANGPTSDEVKQVVSEMMADAETRASLLADGDAANDGRFFVAGDGYRQNVGGLMQFRYTTNLHGLNEAREKVPLFGDIPVVGKNFAPDGAANRAGQPAPSVAPAEFVLHPGQELWVIERPNPAMRVASRNDDSPGSGTMMTTWAEQGQEPRIVPVPLQHTGVQASIAGPIASVQVTQQFANPYSSKIEAVYVFPLPDDAAVNDFVMTIGARSIRGVIREREQAEQIYSQARAQGYHASLMTQERSNIFTQRVANIEPNEKVDVSITYFNSLAFRDGSYEFVFPMVVGPRFNPGSCGGIGAVPVNGAPSGQSTNVSYVRPDMRTGTDISLSVELDAGVSVESIESPSHQVKVVTDPANRSRAHIDLSAYDSIPNRDFVLRYRVAGGQVKAGLMTFEDGKLGKGGFFSMVIVPPEDLKYTRRGPVEMVLVVDCSGSMEGQPLALAKAAAVNVLRQLRPEDSFQVIRFSDTATMMTARPIAANANSVEDGVRYVQNLQAAGGTVLLNGLEPALEAKGGEWGWSKARFVCVISDGLLGNEPEVLGQLSKRLGDSRVFALGIGGAPNRALMNSISRLGRGAAGYVANERDAQEVTDLFMQRVSNAAMTDLQIDWGGMEVVDVYPKRMPDLYVGRPVVITGRYRGTKGSGGVKVSGRVGSERQEMFVSSVAGYSNPNARGLPLVWARTKITDLDEQASWGAKPGEGSTRGANKGDITDLSLKFGLLSAYTSFVAVDSMGRTGGSYGTTVAVPVNVPAGTRYDTTVGGSR